MWAVDRGYRGILCFSARSVAQYRHTIDAQQDGQAGVYIADWLFEDMLGDPTTTNLMLFSGADLIRSVRRYRVHPGEMVPNSWYNAPANDLDAAIGQFGSSYQEIRSAIRPHLVRRTTLPWPYGAGQP
jgi:hypothetical protein